MLEVSDAVDYFKTESATKSRLFFDEGNKCERLAQPLTLSAPFRDEIRRYRVEYESRLRQRLPAFKDDEHIRTQLVEWRAHFDRIVAEVESVQAFKQEIELQHKLARLPIVSHSKAGFKTPVFFDYFTSPQLCSEPNELLFLNSFSKKIVSVNLTNGEEHDVFCYMDSRNTSHFKRSIADDLNSMAYLKSQNVLVLSIWSLWNEGDCLVTLAKPENGDWKEIRRIPLHKRNYRDALALPTELCALDDSHLATLSIVKQQGACGYILDVYRLKKDGQLNRLPLRNIQLCTQPVHLIGGSNKAEMRVCLYGQTPNDGLYRIDKKTGVMTRVADFSVPKAKGLVWVDDRLLVWEQQDKSRERSYSQPLYDSILRCWLVGEHFVPETQFISAADRFSVEKLWGLCSQLLIFDKASNRLLLIAPSH